MTEAIIQSYRMGQPLSLSSIQKIVLARWDIPILKDTLYHILARDGRIRCVSGLPMEEKRIEVTSEQIRDYFANLTSLISGAPCQFVFNFDEMGHQEWADRGPMRCYIPSEDESDFVYFPVSRTGKRITLIACICADGTYLKPSVILTRKTYDEDALGAIGWTQDNCFIYSQRNSFIDIEIFSDWVKDTFVPELIERRRRWSYDGPAFLILDNCSAHRGDDFAAMCQDNRIVPVFLPPHASNQLQPLDLCIFGVTKKIIRFNKTEKHEIQTRHIVAILEGFAQAATPANIVSSFRNAGIDRLLEKTTGPSGDLVCHP
jgi:hypothetical protein